MHIDNYLARLNYQDSFLTDLSNLIKLHRLHVFHIPFENLDIHLGNPITLSLPAIYTKVVERIRGGFCYELNTLFNWLLHKLGFESRIITAQIVNNNQPGPEFDHMAITVKLENNWLLDVGYGDLFLNPIEIKPDVVQTDGANYFMIRQTEDNEYSLWMSVTGIRFEEKYRFSLKEVSLENFEEQNQLKQTSPDSHFVRNLICTQPIPDGRKTIFNQRFFLRKGNERKMETFDSPEDLTLCLQQEFGIDISMHKLADTAQYSF